MASDEIITFARGRGVQGSGAAMRVADGGRGIRALFIRWVEATRRAEEFSRTTPDDDLFEEACGAPKLIAEEIAALSAPSSAFVMAVKVYLHAHTRFGGMPDNWLDIALPDYEDGPVHLSLYADALKCVLPLLGRGIAIPVRLT